MNILLFPFILTLALSFYGTSAFSAEFECETIIKYSSEGRYPDDQLKKYKPSTRLVETGKKAQLFRCGFESSKDKVTCDEYTVDRIATDENIKAKKYYYFNGQFDLQIFKDLTAVENNGRGSIAFQKCRVVAP